MLDLLSQHVKENQHKYHPDTLSLLARPRRFLLDFASLAEYDAPTIQKLLDLANGPQDERSKDGHVEPTLVYIILENIDAMKNTVAIEEVCKIVRNRTDQQSDLKVIVVATSSTKIDLPEIESLPLDLLQAEEQRSMTERLSKEMVHYGRFRALLSEINGYPALLSQVVNAIEDRQMIPSEEAVEELRTNAVQLVASYADVRKHINNVAPFVALLQAPIQMDWKIATGSSMTFADWARSPLVQSKEFDSQKRTFTIDLCLIAIRARLLEHDSKLNNLSC